MGAILGGVVIHLVASEIYERAPSIAKGLIAKAASLIPVDKRARYEEEWLAHLSECEGSLNKFVHAAECLVAAFALKKVLKLDASMSVTGDTETGQWTISCLGERLDVNGPTAMQFLGMMRQVLVHQGATQQRLEAIDEILHANLELRNLKPQQADLVQLAAFINTVSRIAREEVKEEQDH